MKTSTILRRTRKLLSDPEKWTKCWDERKSERKTAYCIVGAISHSGKSCPGAAFDGIRFLENMLEFSILTHWNDHPRRTHKQVLNFLDRAIKRAEKEEAK